MGNVGHVLNSFPPVTNNIGFVKATFPELSEFCRGWIVPQTGTTPEEFTAGFVHAMERMFPITRKRTLLMEHQGGWTAYFSDVDELAEGRAGYIAESLKTRGVWVSYVDDTYDASTNTGQYGGIQFGIMEPFGAEFLDCRRVVSLTHQCLGWEFRTGGGDPLSFEQVKRYKAPRIRDRFTREMLIEYCGAMGIALDDPAAYGPKCVLFPPW